MSKAANVYTLRPNTFSDVIDAVTGYSMPELAKAPARPFVKWVGGKRSILDQLVQRLPQRYTTYNECFLGGGALFFEVQPEISKLYDINFHLIIAYKAVRDAVDEVIEHLKEHEKKHSQAHFLKSRLRISTEKEPIAIAALLIYLNKTCYNGLYRVNKAGAFNVPMGSYKSPAILDEPTLRNAAKALQGATIEQRPFDQIKPESGAFYYLDPPYHQTYNGYNGNGFGDVEHEKLAKICQEIDDAGGFFMLSNSDTDFVRGLYQNFNCEDILAGRYVSCKSSQRGKHNELLIRNYG